MLLLSRAIGESVEIRLPDGRIGYVQVVDYGHGKWRLGFDFPQDVQILRTELARRIRDEEFGVDHGGEA